MVLPLRRAAVMAGLWLACVAAGAGGLQISPVGLSLQPGQAADGLWVTNAGDDVMHAQVRVYRWTQEGDADKLTPSQGLVASPPMLQLGVGEKQLVRAIRLGPPPSGADAVEVAYRVVIDELPVSGEGKKGLNFVMRYSVPVFLVPAGATSALAGPHLSWALRRQGEHVQLEVSNSGSVHAQLADLSFVDAAGKRTALHSGLLGYVLPQARMRWLLKTPPAIF
ncbi:MAG TPA: fimbria/pilus periplasmic chaperone, partial [Methylibium sp.]